MKRKSPLDNPDFEEKRRRSYSNGHTDGRPSPQAQNHHQVEIESCDHAVLTFYPADSLRGLSLHTVHHLSLASGGSPVLPRDLQAREWLTSDLSTYGVLPTPTSLSDT